MIANPVFVALDTTDLNHARDLAARLKDKFPQTDYAWRAAELVFKLDQGIPVYGIDRGSDE